MNSASEHTRSLWMAERPVEEAPPLATDDHADVVIIGAGIAGMSVAYELARAGRSVVVLDGGPIGGGMTGRTTAHLSNEIDDRYDDLIRLRGVDEARLAADSHTAAIARIEEIQRREDIACDFERLDGYLFLAPGGDPALLDRELAAAHRVGLDRAEKVARAPLDGFDTGPALRFPEQGRFHPLKYLAGLRRCIGRDGGRFYTARAVKITGGSEAAVEAASGRRVTAQAVVVATNSPVNLRTAIHTKQAPYRTYVIGARVPRGAVTDALYWDTADPYHYVRLQPAEDGSDDILIVGGEDHKTGQASDFADRFTRLEDWTRQRFPAVRGVAFRWSGQVMEPIDDVAFIGRSPAEEPNVFIATGDSGMGMTHGAIAGILIADLVQGRDNPWARLYDPSRLTPAAGGEFLKENLNVAGQFADYLTGGDVGSVDDLRPGEGALVRRGLKKIAAWRDEQGVLHEHSAVCTHLGCIVQWNALEHCWDCPCHGSQFSPKGEVLNGPACRPLGEASTSG